MLPFTGSGRACWETSALNRLGANVAQDKEFGYLQGMAWLFGPIILFGFIRSCGDPDLSKVPAHLRPIPARESDHQPHHYPY
jgi:hypothetical protein